MSLSGIKALTFDTGGTVLDWHTGFRDAFAVAGARHGESVEVQVATRSPTPARP